MIPHFKKICGKMKELHLHLLNVSRLILVTHQSIYLIYVQIFLPEMHEVITEWIK